MNSQQDKNSPTSGEGGGGRGSASVAGLESYTRKTAPNKPSGVPVCDTCSRDYEGIGCSHKCRSHNDLESLSYGLESLAGMFRSVGKALESQ